jgi:hypothetical protein
LNEPTSATWWLHVLLEVVGIGIAIGIAWGIIKTKVSTLERDMEEFQEYKIISDEFHGTVMTKEDCEKKQTSCQRLVLNRLDSFTQSINDVGQQVQSSTTENTSKWQHVATVLGAICQKLEIPFPKWK